MSFWRKQLLLLLTAQPNRTPSENRRKLRPRRLSQGSLLCGCGLILLGFWHWQLLLATIAGIATMTAAYPLQGANWGKHWLKLKTWFNSPHRQFTLAVGSGGFAAFVTYTIATIWASSENRWFATGAILQGIATLLTLGLLGWQIIARQAHNDENLYNLYIRDLTDRDPLKRLIAIRQLTRLAVKHRVNANLCHQVKEYLSVMLTQETHAIAHDALLDSLHRLGDNSQPSSPSQPLQMPLNLKKSPSQIQI
ncbi:MAG: hypothetical protein SAJ12_24480 [Jaaginema sp. PMC 1079.18]|nr:hypothetical protein [Jaaginema sp. PMC 1080.18]MEC4854151.1 hypothetical protein [Jaaginema sp. PMC 1079.18]MEC4865806.1 hypothetical protein [Jaaginema sp. PMC 1078.18]